MSWLFYLLNVTAALVVSCAGMFIGISTGRTWLTAVFAIALIMILLAAAFGASNRRGIVAKSAE